MEVKACFIGGARHSQPLDATSEKKFHALKPLGQLFVIGFSQGLLPHRFTEHGRFYLLPKCLYRSCAISKCLSWGCS